MKSDTPRTDKAAFSHDTFNGVDPWKGERYINVVPAKLAAELERENSRMREILVERTRSTQRADGCELGASPCSPFRVQRKRVKGWRKPENTVCVDRTTRWGNPFKADWPEGGKDRAWAASAFRGYYHNDAGYRAAVVRDLRGKNLACFCSLDGPCHADVLLEWANAV